MPEEIDRRWHLPHTEPLPDGCDGAMISLSRRDGACDHRPWSSERGGWLGVEGGVLAPGHALGPRSEWWCWRWTGGSNRPMSALPDRGWPGARFRADDGNVYEWLPWLGWELEGNYVLFRPPPKTGRWTPLPNGAPVQAPEFPPTPGVRQRVRGLIAQRLRRLADRIGGAA